MSLPPVSAALTIRRAWPGLTIPKVAGIAGPSPDEVFDSENFIEEVHPAIAHRLALEFQVNLGYLADYQ